MRLNINVEELRKHRADKTARIFAQAERHKRIKSLVILNGRANLVLDELEFLMASSGGSTESTFLCLAAPTRAGKTTALELFVALYPPGKIGGNTLQPVLYVPTPARPIVNDLGAAILRALGDPAPTQGTQTERLSRIHFYVEAQQVKIIIFDELQHLISRENDKINHESADWIKQLMNELNRAYVLAGTERVLRILRLNDQLPLRQDDGVFEMSPYTLDDFEEYRGYLMNWDRQIVECGGLLENSGLSRKEFAMRLLLASQGWPGFTAKLVHAASKLAILEDLPRMELGHFERVFDRLMLFMKRAGQNPFRGKVPKSVEVWLDDEAFETVLHRYEEEEKRRAEQAKRAVRL